jgi:hypothetical protein
VSDSGDLLDKTDALLGRYRGSVKPVLEADFPVLTDIIAESESAIGIAEVDSVIAPPTQSPASADDLSEDRILQEVMLALAPRIESVLGDSMKERLEEHVRVTLQTLSEQLRLDVEAQVRIAVSRAVEQVLSDKQSINRTSMIDQSKLSITARGAASTP